MDVKGPFPKRMLKKGAFTTKHFESDPGMSFKLYEDDPVTRKPVCPVATKSLCPPTWSPQRRFMTLLLRYCLAHMLCGFR